MNLRYVLLFLLVVFVCIQQTPGSNGNPYLNKYAIMQRQAENKKLYGFDLPM
jgi:hypothetical protein